MTHKLLPFPFVADETVIDDRFLVKGTLGQGGMGRCYRVWQKSLERMCVLKMLAPRLHPRFTPTHDARLLLEGEAKTLGLLGLGNDSFVQVFDRGTLYILVKDGEEVFELDLPYYTMEYLHGYSIDALIDWHIKRGEFLPWPMVLTFCEQTARALRVAHERGVIHRDLKPDNIFIHDRSDRPPVVKLIDFGVSTREGAPHVFGTGTLRYGFPEILSRRVQRESTQSDMYPLGLVLYELACLRGPYEVESKEHYLRAHIYEDAPRSTDYRRDTPPAFADFLAALLSKDPEARPNAKQTEEFFRTMLGSVIGGADASAQIGQLLRTLGTRAARERAASRLSVRSRQGQLPTLSSDALEAHERQPSAAYSLFARPKTGSNTVPPTAVAASLAAAKVPTAGTPSEARPPAAMVKAPVILDRTESAPALAPRPADPSRPGARTATAPLGVLLANAEPPGSAAGGPVDIRYVDEDIPVFPSMAQVFEAIWEDDTRYATSPFASDPVPVASGRGPSSSLGAVVTRTAAAGERRPRSARGTERSASRPLRADADGVSLRRMLIAAATIALCTAGGVVWLRKAHPGAVAVAASPRVEITPAGVSTPLQPLAPAPPQTPTTVIEPLPPPPASGAQPIASTVAVPSVSHRKHPNRASVPAPSASDAALAEFILNPVLPTDPAEARSQPAASASSSPRPKALFADWLVRPPADASTTAHDPPFQR